MRPAASTSFISRADDIDDSISTFDARSRTRALSNWELFILFNFKTFRSPNWWLQLRSSCRFCWYTVCTLEQDEEQLEFLQWSLFMLFSRPKSLSNFISFVFLHKNTRKYHSAAPAAAASSYQCCYELVQIMRNISHFSSLLRRSTSSQCSNSNSNRRENMLESTISL